MAMVVVGNKVKGAKMQLVGIERMTGEAHFTIDYTGKYARKYARPYTRNCTRNCTRNSRQQAVAFSRILGGDVG